MKSKGAFNPTDAGIDGALQKKQTTTQEMDSHAIEL